MITEIEESNKQSVYEEGLRKALETITVPANVSLHRHTWGGYDGSGNWFYASLPQPTLFGFLTGRKKQKKLFDVDANIYFHYGPESQVVYVNVYDPQWEQPLRSCLEPFFSQSKITRLIITRK